MKIFKILLFIFSLQLHSANLQIIILRHGEKTSNLDNNYLSDLGYLRASTIGEYLPTSGLLKHTNIIVWAESPAMIQGSMRPILTASPLQNQLKIANEKQPPLKEIPDNQIGAEIASLNKMSAGQTIVIFWEHQEIITQIVKSLKETFLWTSSLGIPVSKWPSNDFYSILIFEIETAKTTTRKGIITKFKEENQNRLFSNPPSMPTNFWGAVNDLESNVKNKPFFSINDVLALLKSKENKKAKSF